MKYTTILLAIASMLFGGCGTLRLNPVTNESRIVTNTSDSTKLLTVLEGMVWYDSSSPSHGLRFPPGVYKLEAEDFDYWYLRSPVPLEFHIFKDGKMTDGRNIGGGIMIGKNLSNLVPAAGYVDGDEKSKVMIWKLGKGFIQREGGIWTRNF
jgi:hypothetical protein